jgi:hypothetical protein
MKWVHHAAVQHRRGRAVPSFPRGSISQSGCGGRSRGPPGRVRQSSRRDDRVPGRLLAELSELVRAGGGNRSLRPHQQTLLRCSEPRAALGPGAPASNGARHGLRFARRAADMRRQDALGSLTRHLLLCGKIWRQVRVMVKNMGRP